MESHILQRCKHESCHSYWAEFTVSLSVVFPCHHYSALSDRTHVHRPTGGDDRKWSCLHISPAVCACVYMPTKLFSSEVSAIVYVLSVWQQNSERSGTVIKKKKQPAWLPPSILTRSNFSLCGNSSRAKLVPGQVGTRRDWAWPQPKREERGSFSGWRQRGPERHD